MERSQTVAILGVGLIGGSIGKALRTRGLSERVVGIGRDANRLAEAEALGVIDRWTTDLEEGLIGADVLVVCTPVTEIAPAVRFAAAHGPEGLLVTDAGSTKRRIVEAVEADPTARAVFVGSHPIAGSERKGAAYARADLFEGRACVLTPTERTPADRLARARAFWSSLGSRLIEINPVAHDDALALTSHLPHAVAAALAVAIPAELLPMAAGAYRDGTRVAGSDAALWAGIFQENKVPVLAALGRFQDTLTEFRQALVDDDQAALIAWWERAKDRRTLFDAGLEPAGSPVRDG